MEIIVRIIVIGIGATLLMDMWSYLLSYFNIKTLDYRLVGRWIGNFFIGKFTHENITRTPVVRYEAIIGWTTHYIIGIIFSFVLVACFGIDWLYRPTLLPALIIGIITIVAPFFIMQPAFGFGIAASKLKNPLVARFMSLLSHSIYGLGLYLSAVVIQCLLNQYSM